MELIWIISIDISGEYSIPNSRDTILPKNFIHYDYAHPELQPFLCTKIILALEILYTFYF